jgi:hypothetical protein
MWTIVLPTAVAVSKKKSFTINLNVYRNAHFQVLDKAKKEFKRVVKPLLKSVPRLEQCSLEYTYYHGKGKESDTNNVCAVADKFFCDTLVSAGVLLDDGPKYVRVTTFLPGGRDRDDPRIEVTIRSLTHGRNQDMKETTNITIEPQDVQQALKDYLVKHRPHLKGVDTLVFKTNDDGSYEVRVESSSSAAPSDAPARATKETKGKGQVSLPAVTLTSQEPPKSVFAGSEELPRGATVLPYPPPPASPAPVLFARSEEPAITADSPPPPPPGKGLFADLTPVSNKP